MHIQNSTTNSARVNKQLINWLNNSVADRLCRFGAVLRTVQELTNNCRLSLMEWERLQM
jgi:hypothetical protein